MSKRTRIYTSEDVANHRSASSCWVSRYGKVYDITGFLPDHPGGDDIVLKYAGKSVEETMKDSEEHVHSDAAYDMMEEFLIGRLGTEETIIREGMCLMLRLLSSQMLTRYLPSRLGSHRRLFPG